MGGQIWFKRAKHGGAGEAEAWKSEGGKQGAGGQVWRERDRGLAPHPNAAVPATAVEGMNLRQPSSN